VLSLPFTAAVLAVGGAIAATATRDGRIAVLGLMLAAVASVLVASPLPGTLAVTARVLAALLACYLLWTATRTGVGAGSPIGPMAETATAAAAFVIGLAIRPVDPLIGPVEAQAAGLALIVLAVTPLAGRDVLRMGMGVLLLTLGGSLEMSAWGGAMPDLEQLAVAALLAGTAGAVCMLAPSGEEAQPVESAGSPVLDLWAPEPAPRVAARISRATAAAKPGPSRRPVANEPAAPTSARHRAPVPARKAATTATPATLEGSAGPTVPVPAPPSSKEPALRPSPAAAPRPPAEARPSPRPMTADPLEFDDWLAWSAPEAEPQPKRRQWRGRKAEPPDAGKDETP
jgi:hypothetical protein